MARTKKSVSESLYEQLRDGVTYGRFKPGERLSEKMLCELFRVSRTPLREAMRRLEAQGYITLEHNVGATVSKISLEEVENIYNILRFLEPYAARLASSKHNKKDIRTLQQIFNRMGMESVKEDYRNWLRENDNFHHYIHIMCKSNVLTSIIRDARNRIYRYRILITSKKDIERYNGEHEKIIEAITSGNADKAEKTMLTHISNAFNNRITFLTTYPEFL